MIDKKKIYERQELKEVDMTSDLKDIIFPARIKGMNTILVITYEDYHLAYVCMDIVPGAAILHLHIHPACINTKDIERIRLAFYKHIHPWCRDNGINNIIVNCPAEDVKTTELFKTFGFKPETINLAVMPVKEV